MSPASGMAALSQVATTAIFTMTQTIPQSGISLGDIRRVGRSPRCIFPLRKVCKSFENQEILELTAVNIAFLKSRLIPTGEISLEDN